MSDPRPTAIENRARDSAIEMTSMIVIWFRDIAASLLARRARICDSSQSLFEHGCGLENVTFKGVGRGSFSSRGVSELLEEGVPSIIVHPRAAAHSAADLFMSGLLRTGCREGVNVDLERHRDLVERLDGWILCALLNPADPRAIRADPFAELYLSQPPKTSPSLDVGSYSFSRCHRGRTIGHIR
jgi:hypothetical protein